MRNIAAIFQKQLLDTLRNKTVLLQFVLMPVMAVLMQSTVRPEGLGENFFVILFAAIYVGMAPMTAAGAIIAEEKEKNTLRVLLLSNVRPREYLIGVGGFVWLASMAGAGVLCAVGNYTAPQRAQFLAVMAAGILASTLIGAAIGVVSGSQMAATSLTVPVMVVFSFVPMIALFNDTAAAVSRWLYSGQVSAALGRIGNGALPWEGILVMGANLLAAGLLFTAAYRRCRLS